ncbi:MAG: oxidoreductase [Candidatus Marinimicrobia bacterium]|nr:oxidoreductase [Candidatus Neomarinimicrobiota bacterium]OUW50812.1 MAG: hypothetical protein CBD50_00820 [bacterium TMED190]
MLKKRELSIGVVGVGHLGKRHLENVIKSDMVRCSGFYEIDKEKSKKIINENGIKSHASLDALLKESDAIIIAVPTTEHFKIAKECLNKRKNIFIEKPICKTLKEADALIKLSDENNCFIQVGHIERLNPAIFTLKKEKIKLNPRYIEIQRLAPFNSRGTDVPVVLDLMIHDLDILLSLIDSTVEKIDATGISIMTNSIDIANARIKFKNGCVANITSSRIAQDYVRKLKVFEKNRYITVDFLKGLTEIYKVLDLEEKIKSNSITTPFIRNGKEKRIVYEKPHQNKFDALEMELENFIESNKKISKPIVSGKDGREALNLAITIQKKIEED